MNFVGAKDSGASQRLGGIEFAIRDLKALCGDGSTENICFRTAVKYLTSYTDYGHGVSVMNRALRSYKKCHSVISAKVNSEIGACADTSKAIARVPDTISLFSAEKREVRRVLKFFHEAYHTGCVGGNPREEIVTSLMAACPRLRHDIVHLTVHTSQSDQNSGDVAKYPGSITEVLKRFSGIKGAEPDELCEEVLLCFSTTRHEVGNPENVVHKVCICCAVPQDTELTIYGEELMVLGDIAGTIVAAQHNSLESPPSIFARNISAKGKVEGFCNATILGNNVGCLLMHVRPCGSMTVIRGSNMGEVYMLQPQEDVVESGHDSSFSGGARVEAATKPGVRVHARSGGKFLLKVMGNNLGVMCAEGRSVDKSEVVIRGVNIGNVFCDNVRLKVCGQKVDGVEQSPKGHSEPGGGLRLLRRILGIFGLSRLSVGNVRESEDRRPQVPSYIHSAHCDISVEAGQLSGLLMFGEDNTVRLTGSVAQIKTPYDVSGCTIFLRNSKIFQDAGAEIRHMCDSSIFLEGGEISLPRAEIALSAVQVSGVSSLVACKMRACNIVLKDLGSVRVDSALNSCRVLMLRNQYAHSTNKTQEGGGVPAGKLELNVPVINRGMIYVEGGNVAAYSANDVHLVVGEYGNIRVSHLRRGCIRIGKRMPLQRGAGPSEKKVRFTNTVRCTHEVGGVKSASRFVFNLPLKKGSGWEEEGCVANFGCIESAEVVVADVPHEGVSLSAQAAKRCALYIRQKGKICLGILEGCSGEIIGDGVELEASRVLSSRIKLTGDSRLVVPQSIEDSVIGMNMTFAVLWLRDSSATRWGRPIARTDGKMSVSGRQMPVSERFSGDIFSVWIPRNSRGIVVSRKSASSSRKGDRLGVVHFESVCERFASSASVKSDLLKERELIESKRLCLKDSVTHVLRIVNSAQQDILCTVKERCDGSSSESSTEVSRTSSPRSESAEMTADRAQADSHYVPSTGSVAAGVVVGRDAIFEPTPCTSGLQRTSSRRSRRSTSRQPKSAERARRFEENYSAGPVLQAPPSAGMGDSSGASGSGCRQSHLQQCPDAGTQQALPRERPTSPIECAGSTKDASAPTACSKALTPCCAASKERQMPISSVLTLPVVSVGSAGNVVTVGSVDVHNAMDGGVGVLDAVNVL
ncbi:hypothetical protein [Anaplasma capra]|uniref:hypothetical protein n=1 Tax=Anaplasma capra TaxID=1562740 RepID=UPI0021D605A3|nr:hypothetical protein [Anaplasma capra]MCU7612410.1 hypothetical protein [Anaplasma capra]